MSRVFNLALTSRMVNNPRTKAQKKVVIQSRVPSEENELALSQESMTSSDVGWVHLWHLQTFGDSLTLLWQDHGCSSSTDARYLSRYPRRVLGWLILCDSFEGKEKKGKV